ncbi:FISUMP domain-containing protein, partial [Bacteroides caecimuris]|uniref:FISUMP domain-containing protein n=1 Tax=Bacteroides caecimuris TaxID=1796613 RepID=UPI0024325620
MSMRIFFFFLLFFFSFGVSANNIQIKEPARVISVSGGYATIEVRLSWENSWRDAENWDAAYLFLKYRPVGGDWTHIPVQLAGNIVSSPYTYMTATPSSTTAPGMFIYRDDLGAGKADIVCRIRWKTNYSREQFDKGEIQLLAQAIEMVFVPAGPYTLGDSLSSNCFADSYGRPIKVWTETSNIGLGYVQEGGVYQNVTVSASYPKGFQGFYIMKYELSQEQYVNFLNTLTLAQQKALLPNWSSLKEGDYIFGDAKGRSCRNGIVLAYHTDPAAPMIFANNFSGDDEYNGAGDGQTIASNYMSIYDLLAYSSWSGLRPMSEMEFEKACRLPDLSLEKRGYAWNKGDGTIIRAMNLSGEGFETEDVGVGNVNFKKTFEGPLRCGIFAKSSNSTPQSSGSTYWGGMEMSGNVRELCRNVNDWNFYWNRHGEGTYNPGLWNASLSYYGVRGGGFTSEAEELQVSDRSLREYFNGKSVTFRDSTVGFRMVRTMELGAVDLNPGSITALTTICPNITLTIQSSAAASVKGMNNIPVRYEWYLNSVKLEGETADTLVYSDWKPGTYYNFERKVICAIGEKSSNIVRVYVTSPALNAGAIIGGTRCAPGFFKIESKTPANITCGYPLTYSWYVNDVLVKDSVGETLSKEWEAGTYRVVRRASAFGLQKDAVATLTVTAINLKAGQIYGGMVMETVETTITNVKNASVGCGNIKYSWYIDSVLVAGASGTQLTHAFDSAGFYQVIRRATADNGDVADAMDTVIVNSKTAICGKSNGTVVDDEENVYTVLPMADDRCWMTQNMRRRDINHRHVGNSAAVDNDETNKRLHDGVQTNDKVYGVHYTWSVAMGGSVTEKAQGICPAGWYVPTDEEWRTLEMAYGMTYAQATKDNSWRGTNEGTQFKVNGTSKFNATLSGYNATSNVNTVGYYWTSTRHTNASYAFYRYFHSGYATIYRYRLGVGTYASLRCIRSMCLGKEKPTNLNPGSIKGGTAGVNFPYTIKTGGTAKVSCGGLIYSWYINGVRVPGQGASLTRVFTEPGTYNVVRRATADDDSYAETSAVVRVFPACGSKDYVLDDQANRYSIKEMGDGRCWMIQNMRRRDINHRHVGNSAAVDNDETNKRLHDGVQANDVAYGVHYIWSVAMGGSVAEKAQGICPAGWYVPTDLEWRTLEMAYGMTATQANTDNAWRGYDEGTQLKAKGSSGFNATLSGYNATSNVNTVGYYWTSTRHTNASYAFYRYFHNGYATVYRYRLGVGTFASVRCIRSMCYDDSPKDVNAGTIQGGTSSVGYPIEIKGTKTATVSCGGLDYTWYVDGALVSGAEAASLTYTFNKAGVFNVTRRATADNGLYAEVTTKVIVYAPCGHLDYVNDQLGNKYNIKEMADGRCWMIQNMRRTDVNHRHVGNGAAVDNDGTNLRLHNGVQTNDLNHGVQYIWSVAMGGSTAEKAQGICPPGWYVPTDLEWRQLEMAYGMTAAQANTDNAWRGYNEGTQLKAKGSSGFNATLSGYNATSNVNTVGYYWTSTRHTNASYAFYRYFHNGYATIYRYRLGVGTFASLRCIRSRCEDGQEPSSLNAGKITGGSCAVDYKFDVKNAQEATVSCGGLYYSWYVNDVLVTGQVGQALAYTFTKPGVYKVVRRTTADNGDYADATATVNVYSACSGLKTVIDEQGKEYN